MKKEYEEFIETAKKSIDVLEEKIEDMNEDFSEDAKLVWKDLKSYFEKIKIKLQEAEQEAELKSELGMMEARDALEHVRDSAEGFLYTVSRNTAQEFDLAEIKAHLAKMDIEDKWEEAEKEFYHLYGESKVEADKLAKKAGQEINDIMLKLSQIV
ncbi:hypothetical protein [Sulfurovum sp. NBC37-1]|uniref:hypothetical protein n=1 Tax=Sulfurovum sp. (strain NBC37-1) TaxID=387093 RepID=UPI00015877B5|nr:hypothetical protein [Sulfurovum sp. NBC37-1]BAF71631.1 hypothetical protein SUN_0672 [Sulfurovum sp. NBC37-1]